MCHKEFICGDLASEKGCWCEAFPAIMPADYSRDCLCKDCLSKTISENIEAYILSTPFEELIKTAEKYRGDNTLHEHIDYTIENGKYVFSKWYHLKRGYCCGNDCRNCSYQQKSI